MVLHLVPTIRKPDILSGFQMVPPFEKKLKNWFELKNWLIEQMRLTDALKCLWNGYELMFELILFEVNLNDEL